MEKNIILIGMMGCGKTTVGALLSRRLGLESADTDALIEQRAGRPIPDIFSQDGEAHFRALELALCRELSGRQGLVIACGGGLPTQEAAMAALKETGLVFWLDRDPGETYDALDVSGRPLAQAGRANFVRRYHDRAPVYRRWADHLVRAKSPQAAAALIDAIYTEVSQS